MSLSAVRGWIKFEKELLNDPRVLKIASRLCHAAVTPCHADVTHLARTRLTVIGALIALWSFADTHIRDDNTLETGKDEIDALIGIAGFCDLLPRDWFLVLDADHVELPGFLVHNGIQAKKRSLAQRRQQKHRSQHNAPVTRPSRKRHAPSVTNALPDLDLDLDLYKKKTEEGVPADVNAVALAMWLDYRQAAKKPIKPYSMAALHKKLAKFGTHEAQLAAVEHSIGNQYQGVYAESYTNGSGKPYRRAKSPEQIEAEEKTRANR